MDPVNALAGTTTIPSHCGQCIYNLTKWLNQVKNANPRLNDFKAEVLTLQLTYEKLSASLQDPVMVEAARGTDRQAGGNLWSQIATSLHECQATMILVNQILDHADKFARRTSTVVKQVTDSLIGGQLGRARLTVQLFNTLFTLPLLMVNIGLQLTNSAHDDVRQRHVLTDITELKDLVDAFRGQIQAVLEAEPGSETRTYTRMSALTETVARFLAVAAGRLSDDARGRVAATPPAVANSADSGYYTVHSWTVPEDPDPERDASPSTGGDGGDSIDPPSRSQGDLSTTEDRRDSRDSRDSRGSRSGGDNDDDDKSSSDDDEIELELTLEYLANGQLDLTASDFDAAEDNFRHALAMAREHGLSRNLSIGAGGIALMLAECCLKQDKDKDAIEVLEPVAEGAFVDKRVGEAASSRSDGDQQVEQTASFKACHLLAKIFLKRCDFPSAEKRAREAFKGQRKLLGGQHASTLDSVRLLIDIYTAKDDKVNARAYHRFLEPPAAASSSTQRPSTAQSKAAKTAKTAKTVKPAKRGSSNTVSPPSSSSSRPRKPVAAVAPAKPPSPAPPPPTRVSSLPPAAPAENNQAANISQKVSPRPAPPSRGESASIDMHSFAAALNLEPDPLPPNIGSTNEKKPAWARSLSRMSLGNREAVDRKKMSMVSLTSLPRNSIDGGASITDFSDPLLKETMTASTSLLHHPALASTTSVATSKTNKQQQPPSRSPQELAPLFRSIRSLRQEGKSRASFDSAMRVLREYDPQSRVLVTREAELKKNLRESHKGLASTGHGYSPIHFFAEREAPAATEIQLLVQQDVDVNAVAYKAGMPGTDPFTPLQRAVERGHGEVVRILLGAPAINLGPPRVPTKLLRENFDMDTLQPLLLACTKGHTAITLDLLQAGAVNALRKQDPFPQRMWHGNSLLHEACWLGDAEMISMLLDYQVCRRALLWKMADGAGSVHAIAAQDAAFEESVIGLPRQTDQFGVTPMMYAVDVRDCTSDGMRAFKTEVRAECLKILLEHHMHHQISPQTHQTSIARMLCAKWTRGPGKGHSIFCYADSTGDMQLIKLVDQFRYAISADERCAVEPHCSGQGMTYKSATNTKRNGSYGYGYGQSDGLAMRLPSVAELMDNPPLPEMDGVSDKDVSAPSAESTMISPVSPARGGIESVRASWQAPTVNEAA